MHYSPQTPVDQVETPSPAPPLLVYANRIRVNRSLQTLTNRLLITALIFIPMVYTLNSWVQSGSQSNSPAYFSLALFVVVYALLCGKMLLNRIITERSLLKNGEPVLTVTGEGIAMRGSLLLHTVFLPWEEIASIEVYTFLYGYLCVRPRNTRRLLQRLTLWEQLLKWSDLVYGMPPLSISLLYLDKPVEEIRQQLYHMYAKELSNNHVQVRS